MNSNSQVDIKYKKPFYVFRPILYLITSVLLVNKKALLLSVYLCYKLYDIINYNIIELSQINILVADPVIFFF